MQRLLLFIAFFALSVSCFAQRGPTDLGSRVRDIFWVKCGECHRKDLRRPKGGFGFIRDLPRIKKEYSTSTNLEDSDIWYYVAEAEEDEIMPPTKSKKGPLTEKELEVIKAWVLAGAPAPAAAGRTAQETEKAPSKAASKAPTKTDAKKTEESAEPKKGTKEQPEKETIGLGGTFEDAEDSEQGSNFNLLAALHPVLVHFPIAFIFAACFFEFLNHRRKDAFRETVRILLLLTLATAFLAGLTGFQAEEAEGYREETVFNHQWLAISGTLLAAVAAVLVRPNVLRLKETQLLIFRILLALSAILIGLAGHEGGLLVYGPDHFG